MGTLQRNIVKKVIKLGALFGKAIIAKSGGFLPKEPEGNFNSRGCFSDGKPPRFSFVRRLGNGMGEFRNLQTGISERKPIATTAGATGEGSVLLTPKVMLFFAS